MNGAGRVRSFIMLMKWNILNSSAIALFINLVAVVATKFQNHVKFPYGHAKPGQWEKISYLPW